MKQHHIIFNVVGITIAMLFTISGCGQLRIGVPEHTIIWTGLITLLVGGGSFANLAGRGLSRWPTISMIVGYFISAFLLPLGIWGIIALVMERKRQRGGKPPQSNRKLQPNGVMFNWLRESSGDSGAEPREQQESEPEFRRAKLPLRRDEQPPPPPSWGLRAVPGAMVSQHKHTGRVVYNLLTPHMKQFMGHCIGAIKRAGFAAKGTGQFSVLIGNHGIEIHLSEYYQPSNDPALVEKVVAEAKRITNVA